MHHITFKTWKVKIYFTICATLNSPDGKKTPQKTHKHKQIIKQAIKNTKHAVHPSTGWYVCRHDHTKTSTLCTRFNQLHNSWGQWLLSADGCLNVIYTRTFKQWNKQKRVTKLALWQEFIKTDDCWVAWGVKLTEIVEPQTVILKKVMSPQNLCTQTVKNNSRE